MKKAFIFTMTIGLFYGCSSQQINTENELMDVAERSQSTDSLLGQNYENWAAPISINNSNRSETNKPSEKTNL